MRWAGALGALRDRAHALPWRVVALAALLVTTICVFVPFEPMQPRPALDESWALGLNQAVAQGLVFGRDIVFTYGPYSFVFSKMYHPATDALMLVSSAYLAITYWLALVYVTRRASPLLPWAMLIVLVGFLQQRDTLLLSYPLLVGVACCRRTGDALPRRFALVVCVLFSSFGLLPLVKGSLLPLCALVCPLAAALFAIERRWRLAICVVVSPLVGLVFWWVVIGQPATALPGHVRALLPMISGYATAMAWPGDPTEILVYVGGCGALLGLLAWPRETGMRSRFAIAGVFCAFLFVALKAGFIRHDSHALISGTALLFAAVLACGSLDLRFKPVVLIVALLGWKYIDSHHLHSGPSSVLAMARGTYASASRGVSKRLWGGTSLDTDYERTLAFIRDTRGIPLLDGTVDIYSYGQTELIASGNRWNPRPVLQSYSVYTDDLDQRNRAHLLGASAPDHILFRVQPIDYRLPALEDGASWPLLLARYQPHAFYGDLLHLRRRAAPEPVVLEPIATSIEKLGKPVVVPDDSGLVFAEVGLEPSILGRFAALVFKPTQLTLTIEFVDGGRRSYGLVAAMARRGFLLSPMVETTEELAALYGPPDGLAAKRLRSFTVKTVGTKRWWNRSYQVTFKRIKRTGDATFAPPRPASHRTD